MPFDSNVASCETDITMPNIGELYGLSDVAVRVLLGALGTCRLNDVGCFTLHTNGIELFKSKNGFDNYHLEITPVKFNNEKHHYTKLGYCN